MTDEKPNHLLQHIRKLIAAETFRHLPDRDVLERFLDLREEAAFAALVERHGAMILAVCQRVLGNRHDAEDACQATFLVLARKAGSIRKKDSLGSWLHGVAHRIASNLKKQLARRKTCGESPDQVAERDTVREVTWREVQGVLDEELQQLPERYRAPLILCYLEGKTRDEAAAQLGWSLGSLRGRLDRGRELLRTRLVRRGVTLPAALLGTAVAEKVAAASLSPTLTLATVKAALLIVSGKTVTGTLLSAKVISLTEGVVTSMFLTKLKILALVTLLVAALGLLGMNAVPQPALAQKEAEKAAESPKEGKVEAPKAKEPVQTLEARQFVEAIPWSLTKVDAEKGTVSAVLLSTPRIDDLFDEQIAEAQQNGGIVRMVHSRSALADFPFAKNAKVFIDGKEASIKDLKSGMRASVSLADEKAAINRIDALSPKRPVLKSTDVEKNTITITTSAGKELTLPLTFRTKIYLASSPFTQEYAGEEGQFTDLKAGMVVDVQLGVEAGQIVVHVVKAYPPVKK